MTPHLAGIPTLETERLILRAPLPQDWEVCRDFFNSERSHHIRDGVKMDRLAVWRAFCHVIGTWVARGYGPFIFCLKEDNLALGMAGPWQPDGWPGPELAWAVWAPSAEGKGYAFEAVKRAREHAFETYGWETAVSYIDTGNTRSIALAERLGAVPVEGVEAPFGDEPCLVYRHPKPEARR